jgi:uncharacterized membrane protein HdeD (DUF308 family)
VLGIAIFVHPATTIGVLVFIVGIYVLLSGIFALVAAVQFRHETEQWLPLLLKGGLEIIIGIIFLAHPILSSVAFAWWIGIWAIIAGVFEIVAAARMRRYVQGEWAFIGSGVVSVLLGLVLVVDPAIGVIVAGWMIGVYAILFGIFQISLAMRLERLNHVSGTHA